MIDEILIEQVRMLKEMRLILDLICSHLDIRYTIAEGKVKDVSYDLIPPDENPDYIPPVNNT